MNTNCTQFDRTGAVSLQGANAVRTDTVSRLRARLLDGQMAPGARVGEEDMAEELSVSRTLIRIAMAALEEEGLLLRRRNKGCTLRGFTTTEICDAIEVRGELEGMAARKVAERGLSAPQVEAFRSILSQSAMLIEEGLESRPAQSAWIDLNCAFHGLIIEFAQNVALSQSVTKLSTFPLAGAGAILFNRADTDAGAVQLARSHDDHEEIFEALIARSGHRAESLMREHAFRSATNKRVNLRDPATRAAYRELPGLRLILADDRIGAVSA